MRVIGFLILLFIISGCSEDPELTDDMLGGGIIYDQSLYEPEKYLLSYAIPNPTPEQALKPVIIASHGYTATTFEWDEFRELIGNRDDVYISQVLLGGHGRDYADFRNSTWKDWQSSIKEEYSLLVKAGYKNIHLLGSSTSCALILELLSDNYFVGSTVPLQILFIDPIVIPSNKSLSLIHIFGPMLGYVETEQSEAEDKVYYHYRPQETLRELQNLLNVVRKALQKGIVLPPGTSMKVYKSKKDAAADPVSAVLIYKGVKTHTGQSIDVEMIDSKLHVYTRLALVNATAKDKENQVATFNDILSRVMQ